MTRPCSCGQPSTQQVNVGHVLRGSVWRRAVVWLCDPCADDARRGRDEARAS